MLIVSDLIPNPASFCNRDWAPALAIPLLVTAY
jgi:hypothetical protein